MLVPDRISSTPNWTASPVVGRSVIIHATRSGISMFAKELEATLNWFGQMWHQLPNGEWVRNPSSQLVIGRQDGQIVRVVPDSMQAWHAAEDNARTWGIELEQGVESDGFTESQMRQLIRAGRHYMERWNVPAIHATSSTEPGFIGHEETEQGKRSGKSDPGGLFDWDEFINALVEREEEIAMPAIIQDPSTPGFDTYLFEGRGVYRRLKDWVERHGEAALHNLPNEPREVPPEVWAYITNGKEPKA